MVTQHRAITDENIIPTKLYIPPQRFSLVSRPRLLQQLNRRPLGKLTIVIAPAGSGKTTLVASWLSQLSLPHDMYTATVPRSISWFSIDVNDNYLARFFTYFILAIQTTAPEFAHMLLSSLQSSTPPDDQSITQALLHELTRLEDPLLIVLDDCHTITNEAIHEALGTLIHYMPPTVHLVMTSRVEPSFSLSHWRVQNQVVEIRAADLRFTVEEAGTFFRQTMGLQLSDVDIETLEERTEGWIAGLQLAALSLRDADDIDQRVANFRGDNRQIADYLIEEVFHHQPPHIQRFLLQTSILPRFCAELCNALSAPQNLLVADGNDTVSPPYVYQLLTYLEKKNLFLIPLDANRRWYRYHRLFAQLLQEWLIREHGHEQKCLLHRHASSWFADRGLLEEALYHAVEGEGFEEAARLLAAVPLEALWGHHGTSLFIQWAPAIPTESLLSHPRAIVSAAAAHLFTGNIDRFNSLLALCEGIESIAGEYALFKCIQNQSEGNFREALHLAEEAGEMLSDEMDPLQAVAMNQIGANLLRLGDLTLAERTLVKAHKLAAKAGEAGLDIHLQIIVNYGALALMRAEHQRAHQLYSEGITLAQSTSSNVPPRLGFMYTGIGQVHYERNELEESASAYGQARLYTERSGLFDLRMHTLVGEVALLCQQGDESAVLERLAEYQTSGHRGYYRHMTRLTESVVANFHLRLGKLDQAIRWANTSGFALTDEPENGLRFFYQILATVRLAEQRALGSKDMLPQILTLLRYLFEQAQGGYYHRDMINILILQTLATNEQGDEAAAQQALHQAVGLARPGGLVRPFLDSDPAVGPLLAQVGDPYASELHHAFLQEQQERGKSTAPPLGLTSREYEILEAISAGLSNKEIEEKLIISHNTVRTHIKNLYSKLDVTSRTQAIRKAHDLKLI